jgi:hypothetical protein
MSLSVEVNAGRRGFVRRHVDGVWGELADGDLVRGRAVFDVTTDENPRSRLPPPERSDRRCSAGHDPAGVDAPYGA